MPRATRRRRLLLVGGGHAHLAVLQRLAHRSPPDWDVTLVSPQPRQLYSGMLPGWIAGHYALDDCAISLVGLAERAHLRFHQAAVAGLDLNRNEAHCTDGRRLPFDLVSIDSGPQAAIAGIAGAAEHALPVRPIEGFVAAWPGVVERWRASPAPFQVAIVGAGAAAVELAFAIRFRATREAAAHVRVVMAGRETEPLAGLAGGARRRALHRLEQRAISWRGGCTVARIEPGRIVFDDHHDIAFDACIVATGAAAPRWPGAAGLATDPEGYIRVDRMLRSISHPHVYAAGDVACYADPRPKSGVYAVRAGPVLADNLLAACTGQAPHAWHPQHRALYLLSTGDRSAIASWGDWSADGRWVWRWKDWIDRRFVRRFSR